MDTISPADFERIRKIYTLAELDGNFESFYEALHPDIMFRATIGDGTPISGEFNGKETVIDYFENLLPAVASFRQLDAMEFVMHTDKIIILGNDAFTITKNGITASSPYASVIQLRDGLIADILIIQDLSAIYNSYIK